MFDFFRRKKDVEKEIEDVKNDSIDNITKDTDEFNENINETENLANKEFNSIDETHNYLDVDTDLNNAEEEIEENIKKVSFFDKLKDGLIKTRDQFSSQVKNLFIANVKIDDELFEELEEILISADIGMDSTLAIVESLRDEIKERKIKDTNEIYPLLEEIMIKHLDKNNLDNELNIKQDELSIILVIGVNGVGKTTTIGKLAYDLKQEGKKVMLAAADTFRAAAIEQLGEWANKADVEMIALDQGADPSAVIFDAIRSAKSKDIDVLICDTAGRLHNKKNLMKELEKINKTIDTHGLRCYNWTKRSKST